MGDSADDPDPRAALERRPERSVAHERELALVTALEDAREPQHVLALAQRAGAEERGALRPPAESRTRGLGVRGVEALHVDPAVDHGRLVGGRGHRLHEPVAQPRRHGHDGRGAFDGDLRRPPHGRSRPRVLDVLAVRGQHDRRPPGERRPHARRCQEVRIHDVGPEPPRGGRDVAQQAEMAQSAAAAVDHRPLQLVAASDELALERRHEGAEVRRRRARIHLRDEEDAHAAGAAQGRVTWTMPRHISSVVPSPQRM